MHIAVCVDLSQVTGDEKSILAKLGGGFLGHLPVAFEYVWPTHFDLTDLTGWQGICGLGVGNLQLDPRQGKADRSRAAFTVIWVRGVHVGFCHAVAFENAMA